MEASNTCHGRTRSTFLPLGRTGLTNTTWDAPLGRTPRLRDLIGCEGQSGGAPYRADHVDTVRPPTINLSSKRLMAASGIAGHTL